MNSKRFSKYLLYAFGEIVLVVIGILIALQINNWNEERKERNIERSYIELLTRDLRTDAEKLVELIGSSDTAVMSKIIILDYQQGLTSKPDSLSSHFMRAVFHGIEDFVPNRGAINEIQSAGGLSLIKNESVRNQILELYNTYDQIQINTGSNYIENRKIMRELVYARANGNFFSRDFTLDEDILHRLTFDSEIRNRLINNWAITYNGSLKELQQANSETIRVCTDYLNDM